MYDTSWFDDFLFFEKLYRDWYHSVNFNTLQKIKNWTSGQNSLDCSQILKQIQKEFFNSDEFSRFNLAQWFGR